MWLEYKDELAIIISVVALLLTIFDISISRKWYLLEQKRFDKEFKSEKVKFFIINAFVNEIEKKDFTHAITKKKIISDSLRLGVVQFSIANQTESDLLIKEVDIRCTFSRRLLQFGPLSKLWFDWNLGFDNYGGMGKWGFNFIGSFDIEKYWHNTLVRYIFRDADSGLFIGQKPTRLKPSSTVHRWEIIALFQPDAFDVLRKVNYQLTSFDITVSFTNGIRVTVSSKVNLYGSYHPDDKLLTNIYGETVVSYYKNEF